MSRITSGQSDGLEGDCVLNRRRVTPKVRVMVGVKDVYRPASGSITVLGKRFGGRRTFDGVRDSKDFLPETDRVE